MGKIFASGTHTLKHEQHYRCWCGPTIQVVCGECSDYDPTDEQVTAGEYGRPDCWQCKGEVFIPLTAAEADEYDSTDGYVLIVHVASLTEAEVIVDEVDAATRRREQDGSTRDEDWL